MHPHTYIGTYTLHTQSKVSEHHLLAVRRHSAAWHSSQESWVCKGQALVLPEGAGGSGALQVLDLLHIYIYNS